MKKTLKTIITLTVLTLLLVVIVKHVHYNKNIQAHLYNEIEVMNGH